MSAAECSETAPPILHIGLDANTGVSRFFELETENNRVLLHFISYSMGLNFLSGLSNDGYCLFAK